MSHSQYTLPRLLYLLPNHGKHGLLRSSVGILLYPIPKPNDDDDDLGIVLDSGGGCCEHILSGQVLGVSGRSLIFGSDLEENKQR